MVSPSVQSAIEGLESAATPEIRIIRKAKGTVRNLGIFASSFNPVTNAHLELMKAAAERFRLDEVLALAGSSNADKTAYEASLIDRTEMLSRATEGSSHISVGLASTGFFVDMTAALNSVYPGGTDCSFIIGFDTFVRILDQDNKYVHRYYTKFADRSEALRYLLTKSRLIVAERGLDGESSFSELVAAERKAMLDLGLLAERILFMPFLRDFSERSATEVRESVKAGRSIQELVPVSVVEYIASHGLYSDHTG